WLRVGQESFDDLSSIHCIVQGTSHPDISKRSLPFEEYGLDDIRRWQLAQLQLACIDVLLSLVHLPGGRDDVFLPGPDAVEGSIGALRLDHDPCDSPSALVPDVPRVLPALVNHLLPGAEVHD